MREGSNCFKIVKMIMERQFAPVIVFSFSKKECEAYALQMAKLDFNTRKYVRYVACACVSKIRAQFGETRGFSVEVY